MATIHQRLTILEALGLAFPAVASGGRWPWILRCRDFFAIIGNLRASSNMAWCYPTEIVAEKSQKQPQVLRLRSPTRPAHRMTVLCCIGLLNPDRVAEKPTGQISARRACLRGCGAL